MSEDMMSAALKAKLEQLKESINTRAAKTIKFQQIKQRCYRCKRETVFEIREELVGEMGDVAVYCKPCLEQIKTKA